MCGLVGVISWGKQVSGNSIQQGLNAITHRGPDGHGIWISESKNIGLGHARLSIIDVDNGAQPLFSEDKSITAIVNGEFYGFKEIRDELIAKGHSFNTLSDSEILIHLYEEYGVDCLKHLRGEFSFVLWDKRKQRLFAARDRFGIKPLCYSVTDDGVYIVSEAKALFEMGIMAKWDEDSFYHSMSLQYTPQNKTLFKNVAQLEAGHLLLVENNNVRIHTYWDMDYPKEQDVITDFNEKDLISECHDKLLNSIKDRMQADVPVCFHLSGGIDSSAILGMASDISDEPLDAFTVSFTGNDDYDELALAQNMAGHANARLHVVNASPTDLLQALPDAVYHGEGLAINGHIAAKYLLNKAINKAGFKVALTGEGADEVLAGYPHLRQDLLQLDNNKHEIATLKNSNKLSAGLMLALGQELPLTAVNQELGYVPSFLQAKASLGYRLHSILSEDYLQRFAKTDSYSELMNTVDIPKQLDSRHVVNQSLYLWTKLALTNYILRTLGDGMEMSHSIEGRLPFLDHNFFDFTKKLPISMKIKDGVEKYILREAVKPYVTEEIYKRQKHPFIAPPIANDSDNTFNGFVQDNLRSLEFKNIPFFDNKKLGELLDSIKDMSVIDRIAIEPVLMTVLTAGLLQKAFKL